jgi:hypothetical protein
VNRRGFALRLGATASLTCGVLAGAWATSVVAQPTPQPQLSANPTTIVPGQQVVVTGRSWPDRILINVVICGADAVDGTVDCANSETATTSSLRTGTVTTRITGALPPKPCPCVVLAKGVYTNTQATTPVTVVGAATAPVPPAPGVLQPHFTFEDLRVLSSVTVGSAMGTSSRRTVEFQIRNAGLLSWTPLLTGRWGRPTAIRNAITMPYIGELAPGATKEVRATFTLPAFSVGTYDVRVGAQVVGFTATSAATTSTTQWPIGLFVVLALILLLIVLGLVIRPRRRRRRQPPPAPPRVPEEPVRLASSAESESRSEALSGR